MMMMMMMMMIMMMVMIVLKIIQIARHLFCRVMCKIVKRLGNVT